MIECLLKVYGLLCFRFSLAMQDISEAFKDVFRGKQVAWPFKIYGAKTTRDAVANLSGGNSVALGFCSRPILQIKGRNSHFGLLVGR